MCDTSSVDAGPSPSSMPDAAPIAGPAPDFSMTSAPAPVATSAPIMGAPPSAIAASAPAMGVGGGGAGGAPSFAAPAPAPAGFDLSSMSPASIAELQSPNPAATAAAQSAMASSFGTPGSAPTVAPAAAPGSLSAAISDPSFGNIGDLLLKNAGTILGAGTLAFEAASQPGGLTPPKLAPGAQPGPVSQQLVDTAGATAAQGRQLIAPLTGPATSAGGPALPPGAQDAIDQAIKSAQASIRSKYASEGLSGSPMEAEALQQAALQGPQIGFQIAQQVANTGLSELGLSSQIYSGILQTTLQEDQNLQNAISNFAAAAAGGGGGQTLKLAVA